MKAMILAAVSAVVIGTGASANSIDPFTGFVGFGDSLSDKGRFGALQPPSLGGRFSDGPTWMEILGAEFEARGQGNFNMALGGATAGPENTNATQYSVVDSLTERDPDNPDDIPFSNLQNFGAQVASFVNAGFDELVGDNPLVTVLIGGNDFLQNLLVDPGQVAQDIRGGIDTLSGVGAQFDSFLVSTLPRFSLSPGNSDLTPVEKGLLDGLILGFNALLIAEMDDLAEQKGLEIEIFDLFGRFDSVFAEAVADGLTVDIPCTDFLNSSMFDPLNRCLAPGSSGNYLFMDNVHPGSYAHSRLGAAAVAQVSDRLAAVPLPAGLPLLLAGIGAMAVVTRRRAA